MNDAEGKNAIYAGEVTCVAPVSSRDTNIKIEGWAHIDSPDRSLGPVRVELVCGNTVLRSHLANLAIWKDKAGNTNGFRFFVATKVMRRIGKDVRLRVRIADTSYDLPCANNFSLQSLSRSDLSIGEIENLIEDGWIVSHWGGLELPFSIRPERKHQLLELYSRLRVVFEEKLRLQLYILGGNLLGLVREGGFLEHDYDLDAGICLSAKSPEDAAKKFINLYGRIESVFSELSFRVRLKNTGHFSDNGSRR